jgi:hypothetical protein
LQITEHTVTTDAADTITVNFIGEGLEFVSVRMNNRGMPQLTDTAAIAKAKALMSQVATFGLSDAECDAAAALNDRDDGGTEARRQSL